MAPPLRQVLFFAHHIHTPRVKRQLLPVPTPSQSFRKHPYPNPQSQFPIPIPNYTTHPPKPPLAPAAVDELPKVVELGHGSSESLECRWMYVQLDLDTELELELGHGSSEPLECRWMYVMLNDDDDDAADADASCDVVITGVDVGVGAGAVVVGMVAMACDELLLLTQPNPNPTEHPIRMYVCMDGCMACVLQTERLLRRDRCRGKNLLP